MDEDPQDMNTILRRTRSTRPSPDRVPPDPRDGGPGRPGRGSADGGAGAGAGARTTLSMNALIRKQAGAKPPARRPRP